MKDFNGIERIWRPSVRAKKNEIQAKEWIQQKEKSIATVLKQKHEIQAGDIR